MKDVQAARRCVQEQRYGDAQRIRCEQIIQQYEQQKRLLLERIEALEEEYEQAIAQLQQEEVDGSITTEASDSESNCDYAPTEVSESTQGRWSPAT